MRVTFLKDKRVLHRDWSKLKLDQFQRLFGRDETGPRFGKGAREFKVVLFWRLHSTVEVSLIVDVSPLSLCLLLKYLFNTVMCVNGD